MDVYNFWDAVLRQDAARMRTFFTDSARISWPCTAENFTAEEFIRANCAYPGAWTGTVERVEQAGDTMISVSRVCAADGSCSFHAVSFFRLEAGRIAALEEYWGDDGPAPQWRRDLLSEKTAGEV